jgi:hypothetical protein
MRSLLFDFVTLSEDMLIPIEPRLDEVPGLGIDLICNRMAHNCTKLNLTRSAGERTRGEKRTREFAVKRK